MFAWEAERRTLLETLGENMNMIPTRLAVGETNQILMFPAASYRISLGDTVVVASATVFRPHFLAFAR